MTGAYKVHVRNNRNTYAFTVRRNITILCGDSGTGKTTLYEMIRDFNRFGKQSNVHISCDKNVIALSGDRWMETLEGLSDSIVLIDEDNDFILTNAFARAVRGSDNYFILETRDYIPSLPYSVDEIYRISGAKTKKFIPVYQDVDRMYDKPDSRLLPFIPEVIITEDSNSGFQFFKNEAEKMGIHCVSAQGKTKIGRLLRKYREKNVAVIADGAAFGSEIRSLVEQQALTPNKLAIFLPESFEWLILASGVVTVNSEWLERTEDYADSCKYMSWEQFYTDLLRTITKEMGFMHYKKERLAEYYLHDRTAAMIKKNIKGILFDNPGE